MSLPIRTKTTVDLQVSEEVQRLAALDRAADFVAKTTNLADREELLMQRVEATADRFLAWLQKPYEDPGTDEEGSG